MDLPHLAPTLEAFGRHVVQHLSSAARSGHRGGKRASGITLPVDDMMFL